MDVQNLGKWSFGGLRFSWKHNMKFVLLEISRDLEFSRGKY
jgi:hypothetical protein